jgi:aconitase A
MDTFQGWSTFAVGGREYEYLRLAALEVESFEVARLPYSLRVLSRTCCAMRTASP